MKSQFDGGGIGQTFGVAFLAVILFSPFDCGAATISWSNPNGGNWSNPGNWDSGTVPASTDDALISLPGDYSVTLDSDVAVNSLAIGGASGTQTFSWMASNLMASSFTVGSNAVITFGPGTTFNLGGTLTNFGTVNWNTVNPLYNLGQGNLWNYGVFNLQTNFNTANFSTSGNTFTGSFNSSGTLLVQSNAGTVIFLPYNMFFTNSGTISAGTNSTLALEGTATSGARQMTFNNGTVITGAGLVRDVNCAIAASGVITVNGTFELDGGYDSVLAGTSGVIQGTQTWTGTGSLYWNGGAFGSDLNSFNPNIAPTNVTTFATNFRVVVGTASGAVVNSQIVNNQGTITWNPVSALEVCGNISRFTNSGLFVLQGKVYLAVQYSADNGPFPLSLLNNTGTLLMANGETNNLTIESGWVFTNSGVIETTAPAQMSAPAIRADGAFQFTFSGPPTNSFRILVSSNCVDWVTLQTGSPFSGQVTFTDTNSGNFTQRFYRGVAGN